MKNDTMSKPIFFKRRGGDASAIGAVERESQHVAGMHRDADLVPVIDDAPIFVDHMRAHRLEFSFALPIVGVLILGREIQVVGIERLDSDERLVASGGRRELGEAFAAAMLGGFGLALGDVRVA